MIFRGILIRKKITNFSIIIIKVAYVCALHGTPFNGVLCPQKGKKGGGRRQKKKKKLKEELESFLAGCMHPHIPTYFLRRKEVSMCMRSVLDLHIK